MNCVRDALETLTNESAAAKSKGRGSDDLAQVAQAATTGRVAMRLIAADREIAGSLDGATSQIDFDQSTH
ncbi:MAG: hypothetical protein JJE16_02100 [Nitrospiraceae bacterium]|nr:hypothetical protein [Nitrospiraceae bacterium]